MWSQYILSVLLNILFVPEHLLFYLAKMLSHFPSLVWLFEILPIFWVFFQGLYLSWRLSWLFQVVEDKMINNNIAEKIYDYIKIQIVF